MNETTRGPGYIRMHKHLGPKRVEALRQKVLKAQEAALAEAGKRPLIEPQDREAYEDYPPPRKGRKE